MGKTLSELDLRNKHNVIVLATICMVEEKNSLGISRMTKKVQEMDSANTVLEEGIIMVLYGKMKDIEDVIKGY